MKSDVIRPLMGDYMTVRVPRSFPDAALSAQLLLSCKEVQPI